jgi:A/G-specific adenine glycosylase
MLQQTQVKTVISYFDRWMRTFPTLSSLASAPLDDVLAHWSGLGYYTRAHNLHKAARICIENFKAELPIDANSLTTLPGIALSTANAIVSQSTGQAAAVLDGNVRRTLARHAAIEGWTGKSAVQKQLWKEAEDRLPAMRGADYTQAIMDLGALICTRTSPSCDECPVSMDCKALQQDKVALFPSAKPPTRVTDRNFCMLILQDSKNRVLLVKRPPSGIWSGLWSLPEGNTIENIEEDLGLTTKGLKALPRVKHRLSHVRMLIQPSIATLGDATGVKCSAEQNWFDPANQSEIGLPRPVSDLLKKLSTGEFT